MKYIIDSYAWIEYLEGSKLGEKVREIIIDNKNDIFSLNLCVAEVVSKAKRKNLSVETAFRAISVNSKVAEITPEIAKEAGLFHAERRQDIKNFGLVDAIILMLAKKLNAKILTGDPHFKDFKEAVFIQ